MFRTTYSTGFRAPTLWEVNGANSITNTGASYNDPVLCPGGVVQSGGKKKNAIVICNSTDKMEVIKL